MMNSAGLETSGELLTHPFVLGMLSVFAGGVGFLVKVIIDVVKEGNRNTVSIAKLTEVGNSISQLLNRVIERQDKHDDIINVIHSDLEVLKAKHDTIEQMGGHFSQKKT